MIKRIIGTLVLLASLAVMALVVLHRNEFSSMLFDEQPAAAETPRTASPEEPAPGPEASPEMPDSPAPAAPAEADSVRLAE